MKRAVAIAVTVFALGCSDAEPSRTGRLLDAEGGVVLELEIAVADTEEARREGLRLHGPLGADEGLLLVFPVEGLVCITNAGVPFPIDVLYVNASGVVTAAEPGLAPDEPGPFCHRAAMVLELPGGTLKADNYWKLELS